jgi:hypothetical protein
MSHMQYLKQSNHNSPLPDSIQSPRRSIDAIGILNRSRVLHTQEKLVNSTCRYKNIIKYISSYHNIIKSISEKINHIMNQITCTQVSSKNKSNQVCARVGSHIVLVAQVMLMIETWYSIQTP